ncbi:MAG: type III-B CRISPR module RAMP protein Cmr1 [Amphritea sp.]
MSDISEWQRLLDQNQPRCLEAELLITTPMFIGDGQQQAEGIRPPSIKGALRFWWRALFWSDFMAQAANNEHQALKLLHAAEADLFGSAVRDQQGGQSRFSIDVDYALPGKQQEWSPQGGSQYLLGQGCYHFRNGITRTYLNAGERFQLRLSAKPGAQAPSDSQWQQLEKALLLWGLLGGLGSRGRKGIGSVSLQSLSGGDYSAPQNRTDYLQQLKALIEPATTLTKRPPFTALSQHSRLDLSATGRSALELLNTVGEALQLYRAWGRNDKVGNQRALKNFPDDHHDGLAAISGKRPPQPAARAVFGLPHNYFFSSTTQKLDVAVKKTSMNGDRRATPLFIHVHQLPTGEVLAMQLLIPAQFLPDESPYLEYKARGVRFDVVMRDEEIDWGIITRYLDQHFPLAETLISTGGASQ